MLHEIVLGSKIDDFKYIKAQRIVQNHDGSYFCLPYLEDGQFKLCFFNKYKSLFHENVSKILGIESTYIRPNDNYPNPLIDACFVNTRYKENQDPHKPLNSEIIMEEQMFVTVFFNQKNLMYGFLYDFKFKRMVSPNPFIIEMKRKPSQEKNFPLSSYFDDYHGRVIVVFRQGETVSVSPF